MRSIHTLKKLMESYDRSISEMKVELLKLQEDIEEAEGEREYIREEIDSLSGNHY